MGFHVQDKWIWDFWFARTETDYHLFYLQADRALGNPDLRHWNVSIGHAVSPDLRQWTVLPDALRPSDSEPGSPFEAFDSYTTWTGSVIQHDGRWYLFYTGSKRSEKGLIQRIGYATSDDLMTWTKNPTNPVIEADPRWYELLDLKAWFDQAWRDPWVFHAASDNHFHAFITARAKEGHPDGRALIAHARSSDLKRWEVLPPLTGSGDFGQMEVPQLVHIEKHWYLLFSTGANHYSADYKARLGDRQPVTGTHYLIGKDPFGPFHYPENPVLVGDARGSLYSGKLIQGPDGQWFFMGFENMTAYGMFAGVLSDPYPVTVSADGQLHVSARPG